MQFRKMAATLLAVAMAASVGVPADARVQSGVSRGLAWEARSRIIGMTPTSVDLFPGVLGGGDPIYFPRSDKSGVVSLITETRDGLFICSGSMVNSRSVLTAAHCVADTTGMQDAIRTTAYFFTGNPNERTPFSPNAVAIDVTEFFINRAYTGEVIDQNDIAVLRLGSDAPDFARVYRLANDADIAGKTFNVAGYGGRSTIGGAFGVNARTGFLREGDNSFDYSWGNSEFGGFFTDRNANGRNFFGFADIDHSWVSDFDSGRAANDAGCVIARAVGASAGFACGTGVGAREVGVAGGDSGGPQFINGRIASVTSYGLSFGTAFGDCRAGLNSSCGEFSGFVPVSIHRAFIANSALGAIPEPGTWAMLIVGFGLVGAAARRRGIAQTAA